MILQQLPALAASEVSPVVLDCIFMQPCHLNRMKNRLFKHHPSGFSNVEALVVIVISITLSFVLVPPLAYRMGWMEPTKRDIDINLRPVTHPGASFVPKNYHNDAEHQNNEIKQK